MSVLRVSTDLRWTVSDTPPVAEDVFPHLDELLVTIHLLLEWSFGVEFCRSPLEYGHNVLPFVVRHRGVWRVSPQSRLCFQFHLCQEFCSAVASGHGETEKIRVERWSFPIGWPEEVWCVLESDHHRGVIQGPSDSSVLKLPSTPLQHSGGADRLRV